MSFLRFAAFSGGAVEAVAEDLARLRIAVFGEFPYLYEGTMEYERDYLEIYVRSARSLVFCVYDGDELVGATTCLPLSDETEALVRPFVQNGIDPATVMYFGESILLPAYRGRGIGHRFFDERERFAREHGFSVTAFCAVDRPADHPQRPPGYRPNDDFWHKRGYARRAGLQCTMYWPDRDASEQTPKTLTFWLKEE